MDIKTEMVYPTRFNGYYVGTDGTVWTHWTMGGKIGELRKVEPSFRGGAYDNDRYLAVNISLKSDDGKYKKQIKYYCHRLIAETLVPNPNEYTEINHIDRNKLNNNIENLEWTTRKNNMNHNIIDEYVITDLETNESYTINNVTDWVNMNWERIRSRDPKGRSKKRFYWTLMRYKNNEIAKVYTTTVYKVLLKKLTKNGKADVVDRFITTRDYVPTVDKSIIPLEWNYEYIKSKQS